MATVVLGHNAVALLLIPAFFLVAGIASAERPFRPAPSLRAGAALVLGMVLAAFFWIPAFRDPVDQLTAATFSFRDHFPTFGQLLYSPWGYGLSVPGPDDGMSFMVGPLHLLAGLMGLLAAIRRGPGRARALGIAAATASGIGIFLASPASLFLWERIPLLQFVQLPWRALVLPTLFLPVLAALALDDIPRSAAIGAVGLVLLANLAHTEPKGYLRFDDEFYEPARIAANGVNTTTAKSTSPAGSALARRTRRCPSWPRPGSTSSKPGRRPRTAITSSGFPAGQRWRPPSSGTPAGASHRRSRGSHVHRPGAGDLLVPGGGRRARDRHGVHADSPADSLTPRQHRHRVSPRRRRCRRATPAIVGARCEEGLCRLGHFRPSRPSGSVSRSERTGGSPRRPKRRDLAEERRERPRSRG